MLWFIIGVFVGAGFGAIAMGIIASARDPIYLIKEEKEIVSKRLKEQRSDQPRSGHLAES
jgi:hypothetical protein